MGTGCTTLCREDGLEADKPIAPTREQTTDTRFWHEKMRFSHASQVLFEASVRGNSGLAVQAVKGLGDPNCCNSHGYRPLQVAISCGNYELLDMLLKAGADINGHAKGSPPPIVLAASTGDVKVFNLLLAHGADLAIADEPFGETALTRAASRGHIQIVQASLAQGSPGYQKLLAQRARSSDGATSLHLAAAGGHREVCDRLLGVGAEPSVGDKRGRSPLHNAVEVSFPPNGVSASPRSLAAKSLTYSGVVSAAVETGGIAQGQHVETANLLVAFGSVPSMGDKHGNGPLHIAATKGMLAMADLLVRYSADINMLREDGRAPLHLAAHGGNDVLCRLLLSQGAEPNVEDATGETPFSLAFCEAHVKCCRALLDAGADVRAVGHEAGWVPPYTEMEPHQHESMRKNKLNDKQLDDSSRDLVGC